MTTPNSHPAQKYRHSQKSLCQNSFLTTHTKDSQLGRATEGKGEYFYSNVQNPKNVHYSMTEREAIKKWKLVKQSTGFSQLPLQNEAAAPIIFYGNMHFLPAAPNPLNAKDFPASQPSTTRKICTSQRVFLCSFSEEHGQVQSVKQSNMLSPSFKFSFPTAYLST